MPWPCAPPIPVLPGAQPPPGPPPIPPPLVVDLTPRFAVAVDDPPQPPAAAPPVPLVDAPRFASDFDLANGWVLFWLATLCRASYAGDGSYFTRAVRAVLPASYPVTFVANGAGLTPGYGIIKLPQGAIVVISGTTNLGQWLEQVFGPMVDFDKIVPPGPDGAVGVLAVVRAAAIAIYAAVAPLVPADQRILWVGHSLGGAVAQVLHACCPATPTRRAEGRCCTFASPKAGDYRLADLSRRTRLVYRRYFRADDVIVSLPPDLSEYELLIPEAFRPAAATWSQFRHPARGLEVLPGGIVEDAPDPSIPVQALLAAAAAFAGRPLAIPEGHDIKSYVLDFYTRFFGGLAAPRNWANPAGITQVNVDLSAAGR